MNHNREREIFIPVPVLLLSLLTVWRLRPRR
jgi:hypothetical protein